MPRTTALMTPEGGPAARARSSLTTRRRFQRDAVLLALPALAAFVAARPAHACSCVPLTAEQAKAGAEVVFEGRVLAGPRPASAKDSSTPVAFDFEVLRSWKGAFGPGVTIFSAFSGASCGVGFQVGQRYLVYAHREDGRLTAGLCRGTVLSTEGAAHLAELGPGQAPSPTAPLDGGAPPVAEAPAASGCSAAPGRPDPQGAGWPLSLVVAVVLLARLAVRGLAPSPLGRTAAPWWRGRRRD